MSKTRKSTPSKKERIAAVAKQKAQRRKRMMIIFGSLSVVILIVLVWQLWPEAPPEQMTGERPLAALEPMEREDYYNGYPAMLIEENKNYQAVIRTDKGVMTFDLFAAVAPLTVNNFVFLANQGFYDGTTFHRVMEDFMAQAGDPSATGTGGPGYRFADEVNTGLAFDKPGLLAMANSGPGTNGSQFFITYTVERTQHLTGAHTIFGELVDGQEVLAAISLREPSTAAGPGDTIQRIDIIEK